MKSVMNRHLRVAGVVALAAALSACALSPEYVRPAAPVPATWPAGASSTAPSQAMPEWDAFVVDEGLRQLIRAALENNRNLRQAVLNVEAARAQYNIQRADRLPGVSVSGGSTRQRTPGELSLTNQPTTQTTYRAEVGLTSYELDLFGRVRSLSEAAVSTYFATEEAAKAARLSVISEVIRVFVARDSAQRRLELTRQTLSARERSLQLIGERRKSGATDALDYHEAASLAEQARADIEVVQRELAQTENALRLLVADEQLINALPTRPAQAPLLVQELSPGMPADLLTRRPDIAQAEFELKARNADIGAARAAFFPRVSLTGLFGFSSTEFSDLFSGASRAWSFTPQVTLPIFDGGRNSANLSLAQVRKDIAIASYEQRIQTAFREVADALVATQTLQREEVARQKLAQSNADSLRLSEARYRAGVDGHLRYLDAQRSSYASQAALIEVAASRQVALVTLFQTLGGGWSPEGRDTRALAEPQAAGLRR